MTAHNLTFEERFNLKYTKTPGCWNWAASLNLDGYGNIWRDGRTVLAHRASWELFKGPLPKGLLVLHKCDNTACVKPEHLFLGTQKDNMNDMAAKGRRARCPGEKHGMAKLTWDQVREIRRLKGTATLRVIAKQFGVAHNTINYIHLGRTWREA